MAMNEVKPEGRKGRESYNSTVLHAKRDKRRQEAEARQRHYDGLTLKQKLELVKSRGGSKRELARLEAAGKPAKQVQAKVAAPA